jgi:hypothetical protein
MKLNFPFQKKTILTISEEEWRPVIGFEGAYEVSSHGRVRSLTRLVTGPVRSFTRKGQLIRGFNHNYHYVFLGAGNQKGVHRLVCEAFHGPPLLGQEVNHIDANQFNNRADNLEWVSKSGNRQHTLRLGRHNRARLTVDQVLQIRARLAQGEIGQRLADEYGVTRHAITNIKRGHTWSFV